MKEEAPASPRGLLGFVQTLESSFGRRFLLFMCMNYFGLKGIAFAVLQASMLPYFQKMDVKGVEFQLASVVAMIPWSMKGFIGVLSDIVPIGRFHKRGYLLVSSLLGLVGIGMLGFFEQGRSGDPWFAAVLFAMAFAFIATFDLLCEGKYSEVMREQQAGSELLTFVCASVQLGALLASLLLMAVIDDVLPRHLIFCMLPFTMLAAWRTAAGDLPEEPARSWKSLRAKAFSEPHLFQLAMFMALGSLVLAAVATFQTPKLRFFLVVSISSCLILFSFRTLPRVLARSNLYMFLISIAYMDLSGPLAYWYTGTENCVENGPHFSYHYYIAVSSVVGSLGAMLGAVLFQSMQDWSFRSAFIVTTIVEVLASLFDLFILTRWNLKVGIPDAWAYLFGDAACQSIAAQMIIMPQALLTARLCPRGTEATVFAILAGFQNFGANIGSILGAQLADHYHIVTKRYGPCDFEYLNALIIMCHIVIPLLCCVAFTWLVPVAKMSDDSAFAQDSPPPSFASPQPSPLLSPETTPRGERSSPGDDEENSPDQEYYLLQEDGPHLRQNSR